jgi:hypothetical protein
MPTGAVVRPQTVHPARPSAANRNIVTYAATSVKPISGYAYNRATPERVGRRRPIKIVTS